MSDWTGADGSLRTMFGTGGGQDVADRLGVPLLGSIPLTPAVIEAGNQGRPVVLDEDDPASQAIIAITDEVIRSAEPRRKLPLHVDVSRE